MTNRNKKPNIVSGGVAQSVKTPKSNHKVASLVPTLGITRYCVLKKDAKCYYPHQRRCSSVDKSARLSTLGSALELGYASLCLRE